MPDLSIIMPSFNRAKYLQFSLRAIGASDRTDIAIEVVVVNDGLPDDTEQVCAQFDEQTAGVTVKYVFSGARNLDGEIKPRNPCMANNVGIKQATADKVILTCPEVLPIDGTAIGKTFRALDDPSILAVPYRVFDDYYGEFINKLLIGRTDYAQLVTELTPSPFPEGNSPFAPNPQMPFWMGIYRQQLLDIGGYDEDFADGFACDDNDLVDRLIRHGCKYSYRKFEVVHLYHGKPTPQSVFDNPRYQRNLKLWKDRTDVVRNIDREWGALA